VGDLPLYPARVRIEEIPTVLGISAQFAQLNDLELPLAHIHPVGREQEEHPRLPLIGGKPPALGGQVGCRPYEDPVCQDAQGGTLGCLKEFSARLEQEELHDQARAGVDLTYMMTKVPANASTLVSTSNLKGLSRFKRESGRYGFGKQALRG